MKTAIITGISGQDGPYLAKFLLQKNYSVVGIVRSYRNVVLKSLEYLGIRDHVLIEEIDLTDMASVTKIILQYSPDEIYNLAAQSSVGISFERPLSTFAFNTCSTNNLLEAIRLFSPSTKMYQASSSEMFGKVDTLPITEGMPMHPLSPYAVSKTASYFMSINYRESYRLFIANGILFNHESYLRSPNFFIKKIITSAIKIKTKKLDKLSVGNLDNKRDFGYAPKYVEAMWQILQADKADDFNICSGKSVALRDIAYYVFEKFGLDRNLIIEEKKLYRPNEIQDIYGDNSKARREIHWNYDLSFFQVLDLLIEEELLNENA